MKSKNISAVPRNGIALPIEPPMLVVLVNGFSALNRAFPVKPRAALDAGEVTGPLAPPPDKPPGFDNVGMAVLFAAAPTPTPSVFEPLLGNTKTKLPGPNVNG